jgi:GAF domain-containing protein
VVDPAHLQTMVAFADAADERGLIAAATRAVVELLGERGSCVLVDGDRGRVVFATHRPELAALAALAAPSGLTVDLARYPEITAALEQGTVVVVVDAQRDPRLRGVWDLLPRNLRSIAAVPLIVGGRRVGALLAQSRSMRRTTKRDLAEAALIGRIAAHLYEGLRLRRERAIRA